jgi:hypothetical protein
MKNHKSLSNYFLDFKGLFILIYEADVVIIAKIP